MKKIFILLAVAILAAGCGKKENSIQVKAEEDTTAEYTTAEYIQGQTVESTTTASNTFTQASSPDTSTSGTCIQLTPLNQYPELPTGCEITSLTMVLNYFGFDADKCDLADNYLDKGPVGEVHFEKAFEGDPRDESSFGCYAPVIVNTANRYLNSKNSAYVAENLTGTELKDLFNYINIRTPVIVWGTLDCAEGHYSVTWNVDGEDITWYTPEHCMVLVGYSNEKSLVYVADPVHGDIRPYDMETFNDRYNSLKKQAVIIH